MSIKHLKEKQETHLSLLVREALQNGWGVKYIRENYVNPKTNKPYSRYAIYHHVWKIRGEVNNNS